MCSKWRAMTSGLLACLLMTLAGLVFAHGASVGSLYIDHPYAMPNPTVANQWIVYFRGIKNEGSTLDRLTHVSTPIAAEVIFEQALPPLGSDKFTTLTSIELPAIQIHRGVDNLFNTQYVLPLGGLEYASVNVTAPTAPQLLRAAGRPISVGLSAGF